MADCHYEFQEFRAIIALTDAKRKNPTRSRGAVCAHLVGL